MPRAGEAFRRFLSADCAPQGRRVEVGKLAGPDPKTHIEVRRAERELFFYTVREALKAVRQVLLIVLLLIIVVYAVISALEGHFITKTEIVRYLPAVVPALH